MPTRGAPSTSSKTTSPGSAPSGVASIPSDAARTAAPGGSASRAVDGA
ncbi:MAG: hypothetical protein K8M05_16970 [Deltaproteobacteria bacterium]|nr:hypothetical protein [Kofleriaceae bacterium]